MEKSKSFNHLLFFYYFLLKNILRNGGGLINFMRICNINVIYLKVVFAECRFGRATKTSDAEHSGCLTRSSRQKSWIKYIELYWMTKDIFLYAMSAANTYTRP